LLTSGLSAALPPTTNYEFRTLWQIFCAGYAIPEKVDLIERLAKLEKRQFAPSTFVKKDNFRVWHEA
jgi:hypothetical protein